MPKITQVNIAGKDYSFAAAGMTKQTVDLIEAIANLEKAKGNAQNSVLMGLMRQMIGAIEKSLSKGGHKPEEIEECLDEIPALMQDHDLFGKIQSAILGM